MSSSDSESGNSDTREILILYATETGNARDAGDYIARQCRRIGFQCRVTNMENVSLVRNLLFCDGDELNLFFPRKAGFTLRKHIYIRSFDNWFWCRA